MATQLAALAPLLVIAALLLPVRRSPTVTVRIEEDMLHVRLGLFDKLFCFRRDLTLPLADVEGVAVAPRHLIPSVGLRLPGTTLPGVIRAGSFGTGAGRDFWDVRRAQMLLVIALRPGAEYRRVILEVPDPSTAAQELRPKLGAFTGTFA
jgi:hypothetical protein